MNPVDALWDVVDAVGKAIGDGFTLAAEILCPRDHTAEDRLWSWESAAVAVEGEICDEADACEATDEAFSIEDLFELRNRRYADSLQSSWRFVPDSSAAVSAAADPSPARPSPYPASAGGEGPGGASDIPQSAPTGQPRGEDPNRLMGRYTRLMAEQTSPVPLVVAGESPRGVSTDQPSLGEPICDNLADLLHRAADVLFASDAHCPALIAELRTRADRFAAVESVIGYGRGTAGE